VRLVAIRQLYGMPYEKRLSSERRDGDGALIARDEECGGEWRLYIK
jgi:hypothetical protein